METRLIRLKEVQHLTGLPRSTLYHLMDVEQFPKPHKLAKRAIAWNERDVREWIKDIIEKGKG